MIRFACPTCKAVLKAPPRKAGDEVACPKCGQRVLIPNPVKPAEAPNLSPNFAPKPNPVNRTVLAQPEAMIHYSCPRCKKLLEAPVHCAGQKIHCPDCNQRLQIPQPTTPAPAPQPPLNKTILANEEPLQGVVGANPPTTPAAKVELLDEVADTSIPVLDLADEPGTKASPDTRTLPADWLDNVRKRVKNIRRRNEGSASTVAILLTIVGGLLAGIGFLMLCYYGFIYDTSVPVYPYSYFNIERVHNVGLMQNRLIGIIIGGGAFVVGLALALVGLFSSLRRTGK